MSSRFYANHNPSREMVFGADKKLTGGYETEVSETAIPANEALAKTEESAKTRWTLSSFFNAAKDNVVYQIKHTTKRDVYAGLENMAISGAVGYGMKALFLGGVGIAALPILMASGAATGFTVSLINLERERRKEAHESGSPLSFAEWKSENKGKIISKLLLGTALGSVSAGLAPYLMPPLESAFNHHLAPALSWLGSRFRDHIGAPLLSVASALYDNKSFGPVLANFVDSVKELLPSTTPVPNKNPVAFGMPPPLEPEARPLTDEQLMAALTKPIENPLILTPEPVATPTVPDVAAPKAAVAIAPETHHAASTEKRISHKWPPAAASVPVPAVDPNAGLHIDAKAAVAERLGLQRDGIAAVAQLKELAQQGSGVAERALQELRTPSLSETMSGVANTPRPQGVVPIGTVIETTVSTNADGHIILTEKGYPANARPPIGAVSFIPVVDVRPTP